jgi:hypothetical protein
MAGRSANIWRPKSNVSVAAIDASVALVVLCSPITASRPAVNEEVRLYRGTQNVSEGKPWDSVILEDFADIRKHGLPNPLMDGIEKKFISPR